MRDDRERLLDILEAIGKHDYFVIDTEIVWAVVQESLPSFKRRITAILQQMGEAESNGE